MSQVAILIDAPEVSTAPSEHGPLLGIAEDAARQVRNQFPSEAPQTVRFNATFSTTTTDADPGAATIRFNSAVPATAPFTRIYWPDDIVATTSKGSDLATVIAAVTTDVKARVTVFLTADPSNFARFDVTSVIDAAGYSKLVGTLKSFNPLSTQTNPNLIFANSAAVTVEVEVQNVRPKSASLVSVTTDTADLSVLNDTEIAVLNAAAAVTALGAVEFVRIAGAAAGEVTGVTGIDVGDVLVSVYKVIEANPPTVVDLTSEFTITGAATIDNTAGTSSSGESLLVEWYTPI